MGRPSRVHISIAAEGGSITSVRVGGVAVLVAEGVLCLCPGAPVRTGALPPLGGRLGV